MLSFNAIVYVFGSLMPTTKVKSSFNSTSGG